MLNNFWTKGGRKLQRVSKNQEKSALNLHRLRTHLGHIWKPQEQFEVDPSQRRHCPAEEESVPVSMMCRFALLSHKQGVRTSTSLSTAYVLLDGAPYFQSEKCVWLVREERKGGKKGECEHVRRESGRAHFSQPLSAQRFPVEGSEWKRTLTASRPACCRWQFWGSQRRRQSVWCLVGLLSPCDGISRRWLRILCRRRKVVGCRTDLDPLSVSPIAVLHTSNSHDSGSLRPASGHRSAVRCSYQGELSGWFCQ